MSVWPCMTNCGASPSIWQDPVTVRLPPPQSKVKSAVHAIQLWLPQTELSTNELSCSYVCVECVPVFSMVSKSVVLFCSIVLCGFKARVPSGHSCCVHSSCGLFARVCVLHSFVSCVGVGGFVFPFGCHIVSCRGAFANSWGVSRCCCRRARRALRLGRKRWHASWFVEHAQSGGMHAIWAVIRGSGNGSNRLA